MTVELGSIKQVTARWSLVCPVCLASLEAGTLIGQPTTRNTLGGRKYLSMWYCVPCATDIQNIDGKQSGGRFFSLDEMQAEDDRRAPFSKRLRDRKEEMAAQ